MTVKVKEAIIGLDSLSRIPWRRILELAARIGSRNLRVLVDSESTGNYINAQEWAACRMKIETEDQVEELKMADGSVVRTDGRV